MTDHYAVDHTSNYFFESTFRFIFETLLVHVPSMISGHERWNKSKTIKNTDKGVISIKFQYAHKKTESFLI